MTVDVDRLRARHAHCAAAICDTLKTADQRLPATVARARMVMALAETEHRHLSDRLAVMPCRVCSTASLRVRRLPPLTDTERRSIERAADLVWPGAGGGMGVGRYRPGRCGCARFYAPEAGG